MSLRVRGVRAPREDADHGGDGGKGRRMFDSTWRARSRGRAARSASGPEPAAGSQFSLGPGTTDPGHLATEAIAAYVDGELRMSAHLRASGHIAACPLCAAEVDAQRHARSALQSSAVPSPPDTLLGHLRSIPQTAPAPAQEDAPHGNGARRRGAPERRRRLF